MSLKAGVLEESTKKVKSRDRDRNTFRRKDCARKEEDTEAERIAKQRGGSFEKLLH